MTIAEFRDQKYETPRLLLRTSQESMTEEVLAFYQRNAADFEATEPIEEAAFYTPAFQRSILKCERDLTKKGSMLRLWMYLRSDPMVLVGTVSFHNIRRGSFLDAECGYKTDRAFRRQGYCREALTAGLSIMFDSYHLHRITAIVQPDNTASAALLTSLGFVREGRLRQNVHIAGAWRDHDLYALLR